MEHINLVQHILECLLDGDSISAVYALRSLADDIEDGADIDPGEVFVLLTRLTSDSGDFVSYNDADEDDLIF